MMTEWLLSASPQAIELQFSYITTQLSLCEREDHWERVDSQNPIEQTTTKNTVTSIMLLWKVCFCHTVFFPSAGKPRSVGGSECVQLSGVFNVRKGKLALPVNRWSKRQVTLSGTCLIVSSVKHAHTGKMHILPLIGGKVLCETFHVFDTQQASTVAGYLFIRDKNTLRFRPEVFLFLLHQDLLS